MTHPELYDDLSGQPSIPPGMWYLANYWTERGPAGTFVVRDEHGCVVCYCLTLETARDLVRERLALHDAWMARHDAGASLRFWSWARIGLVALIAFSVGAWLGLWAR